MLSITEASSGSQIGSHLKSTAKRKTPNEIHSYHTESVLVIIS